MSSRTAHAILRRKRLLIEAWETHTIASEKIQDRHGIAYFVNPRFHEAARDLLARLDGLEEAPGTERVKQNMVRSVFRVEAGGLPLYLKRYHSPGLVEALKSLVRPSRAKSEWRAMIRLEEAGIATASPVLYGEQRRLGILKGALFAATAVPDALPFGAFVESRQAADAWSDPLKREVYGKMAALTAALHEADIRHGDFHLGNLLVARNREGAVSIHLIDLHTVSFPNRLGRKDRILNLARVAEVLSGLDHGKDLLLFLEAYLKAAPRFSPTVEALRSEVEQVRVRLMARRLKSRTRRCLLKSTEFTPAEHGGFRMHLRRAFTLETVMAALEEHDGVKAEGDARLLHPVFKNKVTAVTMDAPGGPGRLCVKEYGRKIPWLCALWPFTEGRRSWVAGRGLEVRGIATPLTVAWVRGRGREFVITLQMDGAPRLHRYIADGCLGLAPEKKAAFQRKVAEELAVFVRGIHDAGVRHKDLSEQNILVEEGRGGRRYYLIDLDTVIFNGARVNENLVQLGHMPEDIDVLAKARFLERYLGGRRGRKWKQVLIEVNEAVLKRMDRKRRKFVKLNLPDPHPRPSRLKGGW